MLSLTFSAESFISYKINFTPSNSAPPRTSLLRRAARHAPGKRSALRSSQFRQSGRVSVSLSWKYHSRLAAYHESPLLKKPGKSTTGKGCQYIKKVADVDKRVLQELINEAYN